MDLRLVLTASVPEGSLGQYLSVAVHEDVEEPAYRFFYALQVNTGVPSCSSEEQIIPWAIAVFQNAVVQLTERWIESRDPASGKLMLEWVEGKRE
jgi:hypothetical protein